MVEKHPRGMAEDAAFYAYEVAPEKLKKQAGTARQHLPAGTKVLSPKPISAAKSHDLGLIAIDPGRLTDLGLGVDARKTRAYGADARSRALLRGVELLEKDLEASGGAFDLAEVQKLLHGISRQAVHTRVKDGSLLAVPGPSNRAVYPVLQFQDDGSPVAGLKEVKQALGTASPWMLLNFLANKQSPLDGRKPIDLLKAGKLERVVEAARSLGRQGG
jgi:hypothetical protein